MLADRAHSHHRPELAIDLGRIVENFERIRAASGGAEAAAVVKCDAYGGGARAIAATLADHARCKAFYVAYPEEGVALRQSLGPRAAEIFVFNGPAVDDLDLFKSSALTPVINSIHQARLWADACPQADAALHVDTGLNRLGLPADEISALPRLRLSSIISHLACASDPGNALNLDQRRRFEEAAARFPNVRRSLAASAGALIGTAFGFDQVRIGVGLFGASPFDDGSGGLLPAARLTAPVVQVKTVAAGQSIGYGATFTAAADTIVATVALGYGDGYPRSASGRGAAILNGRLAPILGRVSMDLIVLCAAPGGVAIGDRAEFFGGALPIETAAAAAGLIPYELLTAIGGLSRPAQGVGARVRRRYLWNGAPVDVGGG